MLWDIPDDPRGALRWSLSKLRTALGDHRDILLTTRDTVALDKTKVVCDWDDLSTSITDLGNLTTEELVKLNTEIPGDFLEGLTLSKCPAFDSWRLTRDEQARRWRIELMTALLSACRY